MLLHNIIATFNVLTLVSAARMSSDGKCGIVREKQVTCLNSIFGSCCSQYGWCGSSSAYCAAGCQSAFGNCKSTALPSTRGSTHATSSLASSTRSSSVRASSTPSAQPVSTNARCGLDFGGRTCLGSRWGNCCSQYSYCGSTSDYCAPKKCQIGYGLCSSASSSSPKVSATARTSSSSVQNSLESLSTGQLSTASSAQSSSVQVSSTIGMSSSSAVSAASSSVAVTSSETVSSSVSSFEPAVSPTPSSVPVVPSASPALSDSSSSSSLAFSTVSPSPSLVEPVSSGFSTIASSSVSASPSPSAVCVSQLLTNGDFETGSLDPWMTYCPVPNANPSFSVPTDDTGSNRVYQVASASGLAAHIRQTVSIPDGPVTYTCSFRYRFVTGQFYGGFEIYAQVANQKCATSGDKATEWTSVTGSIGPTVTLDTTAYLWVNYGATNVQIQVDDFVISACSVPS